jgi:hypothetical protein
VAAILVDHSYGGAVITEAGNDPNVAGAGLCRRVRSRSGQSVASLIKRTQVQARRCSDPAAAGWLCSLDKAKFAESFAADVAPDAAAFMADARVLHRVSRP